MKSITQHILEKLKISQNTKADSISEKMFKDALQKYGRAFNIDTYCRRHKVDPLFTAEIDDEIVCPFALQIDKEGNLLLNCTDQGNNYVLKIVEFDDFVDLILDRDGFHKDDPTTGQEHLERIYKEITTK